MARNFECARVVGEEGGTQLRRRRTGKREEKDEEKEEEKERMGAAAAAGASCKRPVPKRRLRWRPLGAAATLGRPAAPSPPRRSGRGRGTRTRSSKADVAQLVEQLIRNQQVAGSIPAVGSIKSMT